MPQFAVYQNKNAHTKKRIPFLLDVQANLLDELQTRVVVPLATADAKTTQTISRLTPLLKIKQAHYVMLTPQLAGINKRELGQPVEDLSNCCNDIVAALDFLSTGF